MFSLKAEVYLIIDSPIVRMQQIAQAKKVYWPSKQKYTPLQVLMAYAVLSLKEQRS